MKKRTKMFYAWDNWFECHPRTAWLVVEMDGRVVAYPRDVEPVIVGRCPPLWCEGRLGTVSFLDMGGYDYREMKEYVGDQDVTFEQYENVIRAEGCDMVAEKLSGNASPGAETSSHIARFIAKELRPKNV